MRRQLILPTLLMAATIVPAHGREMTLLSLGKLGRLSCFVWQSTSDRQATGEDWLFGYWTALNDIAAKRGRPQSRLGRAAVVAEVTKTCARNPSQIFAEAASDTFLELTMGKAPKRPEGETQ
jgi:hypothetical protein